MQSPSQAPTPWDRPIRKTVEISSVKLDFLEIHKLQVLIEANFVIVQSSYNIYLEQYLEGMKFIIYDWEGFSRLSTDNNKYVVNPLYKAKKWDSPECYKGEMHQIFECNLIDGSEITLLAQPNIINWQVLSLQGYSFSLPSITMNDLVVKVSI